MRSDARGTGYPQGSEPGARPRSPPTICTKFLKGLTMERKPGFYWVRETHGDEPTVALYKGIVEGWFVVGYDLEVKEPDEVISGPIRPPVSPGRSVLSERFERQFVANPKLREQYLYGSWETLPECDCGAHRLSLRHASSCPLFDGD